MKNGNQAEKKEIKKKQTNKKQKHKQNPSISVLSVFSNTVA